MKQSNAAHDLQRNCTASSFLSLTHSQEERGKVIKTNIIEKNDNLPLWPNDKKVKTIEKRKS